MIRRWLVAIFVLGTMQTAGAESGVIVARTSPDVVLIWRVNEAVAGAMPSHPSVPVLEDTLAAQALGVMLRAMPADARASAVVTVKLVYFSDGGYDPAYRIETVSGVRRIGEISCTVGAVDRNAKRWQAGLARGRIANGLTAHFEPGAFNGL